MRRARRLAAIVLLTGCLGFSRAEEAEAQAMGGVYGLITGTTSGLYVSTAVFVARARTGSYLYSLDDALRPRWELIPLAGMTIGSVAVGLHDEQRLANGIKWGAAGFAAGAVVGLGVGTLFREGTGAEAQWAGAIIGSAAGLLAGSIYGALSYDDEGGGAPVPLFTLRVPL